MLFVELPGAGLLFNEKDQELASDNEILILTSIFGKLKNTVVT